MTHNPHSGSCQGACCLKIQDLSVTFGTDAVLEMSISTCTAGRSSPSSVPTGAASPP